MVDHGASVTDTQLQIARDSALIILNAVDEHDKVCCVWGEVPRLSVFHRRGCSIDFIMLVGTTFLLLLQISVLSVAEAVRSCSLDQCYKSLLSPATSETKRKMSSFISSIKASEGATQHAAGFQKAFQLLRNTSSLSKQSSSKEAPEPGRLCPRWQCDEV